MLYVLVGHRLANVPSERRSAALDRLSLVVAIGAVAATPLGIGAALPAAHHPTWLLWGLGVGICSTVIPYLTDQLAMVRLPRATYSVMLALLPVTATGCGVALLHQVPGRRDLAGLVLVVAAVAAHRAHHTTNQGDARDGVHDPRRQRSRRLATRAGDDELRRHQRGSVLAPRPRRGATDRAECGRGRSDGLRHRGHVRPRCQRAGHWGAAARAVRLARGVRRGDQGLLPDV